MIFILLIISLALKNAESFSCNSSTEFACRNSKCIPLEWQCDNIADCSDGTDEQNCNYLHHCRAGMMMCRDGSCIAEAFKCDGEADCPDGHDEHSCENVDLSHLRRQNDAPQYYNTDEECTSPKHLCKTGGQCLSETAICDSVKDCPDGDDEEGCHKSVDPSTNLLSAPSSSLCTFGHKKCASDDVCIPSYWICDGAADCADGSDEHNCDGADEERDVQSNNALCKNDEYRCEGESGKCLALIRTCDGTPDCPHGDDEGEKKCHDCTTRGCGYKCRLTAFGGECYCPNGATLNDDGQTCSSIDHCKTEEAKRCQHFCRSSEQGYNCYCAPKYLLGKDAHSCHVEKNDDGHILLAFGSSVRSMPLYDPAHSNDGYTQLKAEGSHGSARMIDYNHHDDTIYMSLTQSFRSSEGELAAIVNGTEKILRQNIMGIENIAVDHIGGNIYYTQKYPAEKPGIYVCTANGLFCKRIIAGNRDVAGDAAKRQTYRGLALHPTAGKMVWIELYNRKHKIMIANMDGSDARILLDNKLEEPQGVAIDPITDDVYYADFSTTSIEKINLKTKERHVVVSRGVHHPFDLKYFDGYLYWSDWGTESLKSVEISSHHALAQTLHSFRQFPMGLAIKHQDYQVMPSVNPCDAIAKSCQWMCVSIPGSEPGTLKAQCVCPENYKYEEETCIPRKAAAVDAGDSYIGTAYMEDLCSKGIACLNGGQCSKTMIHDSLKRISCSCAASFTGERCEISDPHAKPLVKEDDNGSSGWTVFWFLFFIFALMVVAFAFLYQKSRRVNQFTRTTLAHIEATDLSGLRPIVDNVKSKLQTLPSRLSASTSRFSHAPAEASEAGSPSVHPIVTFNNPMYTENPPTRRTSISESSLTWNDSTQLK